MAACPAGDDVIGPFLGDRRGFLEEVVNPLQEKVEPVYVIPGSDAEAYVTRRFPHKRPRRVGGGRRPGSIRSFLFALPHFFQRHASEGLDATYHFTFTGEEAAEATVVIRDKSIRVEPGHVGTPDLGITADGRTWLGFLAKERSLVWALLRRKVRLKGSPRLLVAFGKCFPSSKTLDYGFPAGVTRLLIRAVLSGLGGVGRRRPWNPSVPTGRPGSARIQ
jgi:hypothetical protein